MSTADALLAAVCAAPADDLPRLVYADWCEENGDPERAEFIRLQLRRAGGGGQEVREKVLFEANAERWLAPLRRPGEPLASQRSHAEFRRGFVEAVWLPAGEFVRHAGRLFGRCPVDELRVFVDRLDEVNPLAGCEHLARLRVLDVSCPRFGHPLALPLSVAGGRLPRLKVLRMAGCGLTDGTSRLLCQGDLSVEVLDLRHNLFSAAAKARLRRRFGPAVVLD